MQESDKETAATAAVSLSAYKELCAKKPSPQGEGFERGTVFLARIGSQRLCESDGVLEFCGSGIARFQEIELLKS